MNDARNRKRQLLIVSVLIGLTILLVSIAVAMVR